MPDMFTMAVANLNANTLVANALTENPHKELEFTQPLPQLMTVNPLLWALALTPQATRGATRGTVVAPTDPVLPSGPAAATIIDSIPFVQDGHVIRAEDHNALLSAIRLIARLLDTGEISQEVTVTAAPVLLQVLNKPAFQLDEGFARGTAADNDAVVGWMPLDLPDGFTIDSLRLRGAFPGTELTDWPVSLRRVEHGKQDDETVISGNLKTTTTKLGSDFDSSFAFDARGHSRAEADALSRVDTSKYRYQFHTTLSKAKPTADAKLFSIQVTCVRD